jgi:hypothetical protein
MDSYPRAAMERAMKVQDVMLQAMAKRLRGGGLAHPLLEALNTVAPPFSRIVRKGGPAPPSTSSDGRLYDFHSYAGLPSL